MAGSHCRFGIKQIHLRRCPGLKQIDDPLRLRSKIGKPWQCRLDAVLSHQRPQGGGPDSCRTLLQKCTTIEGILPLEEIRRGHG